MENLPQFIEKHLCEICEDLEIIQSVSKNNILIIGSVFSANQHISSIREKLQALTAEMTASETKS